MIMKKHKMIRDELTSIDFPENVPEGFTIQPFSLLKKKTNTSVSTLSQNRVANGRFISDGAILVDSTKIIQTRRKTVDKIITDLRKRNTSEEYLIKTQEQVERMFNQYVKASIDQTETLKLSTVIKQFERESGKCNQVLFLTDSKCELTISVDLNKYLFMKSLTGFDEIRSSGAKSPIVLFRDGVPVGLIGVLKKGTTPQVPSETIKRHISPLSNPRHHRGFKF